MQIMLPGTQYLLIWMRHYTIYLKVGNKQHALQSHTLLMAPVHAL
jgi:hypothetical protein